MTREFNAVPGIRQRQTLFVGLVGPSGAGKTFSALEMATGMQSVFGGDIAVIDTENGRSLAYADEFKFLHIPFEPPWGSLDYEAALKYAATKAKTIVVDGASNEHDEMLEFHEAEVFRMAGNDYAKQERVKMLAWAKPKAHRRKLVQTVSRLDANVIMCFRAKETSKPGKDGNGKSVVIPMGFVPMAAPELTYEMALSALLLPAARGVPTWNPEHVGERVAVKLPKQFEWLRERKGPLDREVGRRMAEWAQGPAKGAPVSPQARFEIVGSDGRARDMGAPDAWLAAIRKGLPKLATEAAVMDFIARNGDAIAAVGATHPEIADEARAALMERKSAIAYPADPEGTLS